jgi:hypothetical protein
MKHASITRYWLGLACLLVLLTCSPALSQLDIPNIQGTWEISVSGSEINWNGGKDAYKQNVTVYIYQTDYTPNTPNLTLVPADEPTAVFQGIVQGTQFAAIKTKEDDDNLGYEMITGTITIKKTSMTIKGTNMGFDTNPDWGGTWLNKISGKRVSPSVP